MNFLFCLLDTDQHLAINLFQHGKGQPLAEAFGPQYKSAELRMRKLSKHSLPGIETIFAHLSKKDVILIGAVAWVMLVLTSGQAALPRTVPEVLRYCASASGKPTLDEGEGGGNPFASAVIEALSHERIDLAEFTAEVRRLTAVKSDGLQSADVP